jgi:hypothetical protein
MPFLQLPTSICRFGPCFSCTQMCRFKHNCTPYTSFKELFYERKQSLNCTQQQYINLNCIIPPYRCLERRELPVNKLYVYTHTCSSSGHYTQEAIQQNGFLSK